MKDYIKLTAIFLLFFVTINLESSKAAPPTFSYFFCALILIFGLMAYRRHRSRYMKTMIITLAAVQLVFSLALPYWVFKVTLPLNAGWPYFPEVLWATGSLVLWYYAISFILTPIAVYLYGRRAWCSFFCGTGAMAEIIGDPYRDRGAKGTGTPASFIALKWVIIALTVIMTIAALGGFSGDRLFGLVFLVVFILLIRTLVMNAVNIISMPKLGTRVWCRYFCPQGMLLGLISRAGRFALVKDEKLCQGCGTCNSNCSMGIDVKGGPAVNRSGDCVGCGVCVEMCPGKALSMTAGSGLAKEETGKPVSR
jgi:polyferredoxin